MRHEGAQVPTHSSAREATELAAEPSAVELEPARDSGVRVVGERSELVSVEQLLKQHYEAVWRFIRRLGVRPDRVEDATQEVFIIVSNKLERVEPGRELRFLYAVALRVAANHRSAAPVRREVADAEFGETLPDPTPDAEALLDRKRLRVLLDEVLDSLPAPLREVFVLHELEGLPAVEIAETSGVALGTVNSRLRRARTLFALASRRLRARYRLEGSMP
jgi:RNA polymerase sigma-70 factor (ECF subfamily)